MKLSVNRMEALVDGIFAIVMTIMLVSLIEVLSFSNPANNEDFHKLFLTLCDDFLVYVASFLILGILWFEHHLQFHHIKYADPVLVAINIVWLMFLCLVPFSTMLLGNHPNFFAPVLLFEFNILIVFLFLCIHWSYATHKGRLTEAALDKKTLPKHRKLCVASMIVTLSAIAVTFLSSGMSYDQ